MISGDTIAAIATAPGRGGIAVVRVSGPDALPIAGRLTGGKRLAEPSAATRSVAFCKLRSPADPSPSAARIIDEAVVVVFRAPCSYTGEDVVEFQCHGGSVTPRRVLEACLAAGARQARRGEFTERAFLNGRLGYEQAESVLDLIDAKTARAADAALDGLAGSRSRDCRSLYERAVDLSTRLEYALDVDEGELPGDFFAAVQSGFSGLRASLRSAIKRANEGRLLREGALVVIAGPPNAGKSSLLNALLRESRAIVSDIPGTTRDSIEAWMDLDGWPVRLVDTAGIRDAIDLIEAEGVKRSEELIAEAEVVIGLGGLEGPQDRLIRVHAKCDLARGEGLNVSSKTGEGLQELKHAIVRRLEEKSAETDVGDSPEGEVAAFHEALATLDGIGDAVEKSCSEENLVLAANAVRNAAERLGQAVGATYSSDMLDNLFSRFCVGK